VQSLLNLKQQVKHDVIELTINENHHLATLKAGAIIGLDDAIELTKLGEEEEEVDRVEH
jgi:hypothetical protein